ncbi:MAG: glycosyltransferase [Methanosphaera sp.]|nr:glycosyltransferase [Methanosphaera sp.]
MKNYTCIFPGLYNYNLTKDVGMIPYTLSDRYDAHIVTYDNDEYFYLDNELKSDNFKLEYLDNTNDVKRDVTRYLKENSKDIDVLQLYHLKYNLLAHYISAYKLGNKRGKIYLKLDANNEIIDFLVKRKGFLPSLRRLYAKILFGKIDLISIETKRNYNLLKDFINEDKLLYIPNGITKSGVSLDNKEKRVLYVGYVEKKNKSIDLLINAFVKFDTIDWKLILIGKVEDDMKEFLNTLFDENPEYKDKIILKGYVSDREVLANEYAKSSIYCCTSNSESFGISTLEAAYFSNYIISTDVGASPDIIDETGYGQIVNHDEVSLIEALESTIQNWENIAENPYDIQKIVYDNFNWEFICEKIAERIG